VGGEGGARRERGGGKPRRRQSRRRTPNAHNGVAIVNNAPASLHCPLTLSAGIVALSTGVVALSTGVVVHTDPSRGIVAP
jgi:hypothetical protein